MFGKNEDRVIDNLLRANTRGRSGAPTSCREFDPDLANAYIERSLTAGEQVGYERHLSVCHACRSSMVALARMAAAEAAPYSLARPVIEPGRFATLKSLFTAPVLPRMAAAALAIIVLAISIPLLISRKDSAPSPAASSSEAAVADQKAKAVPSDLSQPQAPTPGNESVNAPRGLVSTSTTEPSGPAKTVEETDRRAQDEIAVAKEQPTEPDAAAAGARAKLAASHAASSDAPGSAATTLRPVAWSWTSPAHIRQAQATRGSGEAGRRSVGSTSCASS